MQLDKILFRLIVLSVPFYFLRFSIGPIPTTMLEIIIYLAFIAFLIWGKIDFRKNKKLIFPALVFLIIGLVGALFDPDLISGLGLWKAYFLDGFLVFLMALSVEKEDFREPLFLSAIIVSALALILYFVGVKTTDGRLLDLDRLSPNYLEMFLVPILVIALFNTLRKLSPSSILGIILILSALYLTGSRGALAALAGALIGCSYFYLRANYKRWSLLALFLMTGVFLAVGYLVYKPDWSDHARKATSSNVRYYIWTTSGEIVSKKWLTGVGLSNFQNYFSELTKDRVNFPEFISPQALTAHNIYLQMIATCGILGLISFLYFIYQSGFLKKNSAESLAMFALLAYGLVDTPFFRNDLAVIFWLIMALIYKDNADVSKA